MPFRLCLILAILALSSGPIPAAAVEPVDRAVEQTGAAPPGEAAPAITIETEPAIDAAIPDAAEPPPVGAEPAGDEQAAPPPAAQPFPIILRGDDGLPDAVRETRRKLIEAARSGDMEQLRAVVKEQAEPPSVAFDDVGDPIDYLKALASDAGGREILAILLEVLEAGYVHLDASGPEEIYLWPYFAAYPLEALTPPQLVELFTLLASAEYEEMRSYGAYTFFRVGIGADGRWRFFLAGD